jgi:hypothetical protein
VSVRTILYAVLPAGPLGIAAAAAVWLPGGDDLNLVDAPPRRGRGPGSRPDPRQRRCRLPPRAPLSAAVTRPEQTFPLEPVRSPPELRPTSDATSLTLTDI